MCIASACLQKHMYIKIFIHEGNFSEQTATAEALATLHFIESLNSKTEFTYLIFSDGFFCPPRFNIILKRALGFQILTMLS